SSLRIGNDIPDSGFLRNILADILQETVNPARSALTLVSSFLLSLLLAPTFSFAQFVAHLQPRLRFVSSFSEGWTSWQANRARDRANQRDEARQEKTWRRQRIFTDQPAPALETKEQPHQE